MGGKERLGKVEKSMYSEVGWVTGRLGGVTSISLPVGEHNILAMKLIHLGTYLSICVPRLDSRALDQP